MTRHGRRRIGFVLGAIAAAGVWAAAATSEAAAADGWPDSRDAGVFVCRADFPLKGLEQDLRDLARLQTELSASLKLPAPKERIEIYLFHDKAAYTQYLARYLPNVPFHRALYVKSRGAGKVFAYWSGNFEVDLRHECTHALLHASLPAVPLWLDEGLAQYFEVPAPDRANGHPHLAGVRASVSGTHHAPREAGISPILPMDELEKKTSLAEMGQREYRDAWAWVHLMMHGPAEAREVLVGYLGDLQKGGQPAALGTQLAQRLGQPQQCLATHFRERNKYTDNDLRPVILSAPPEMASQGRENH